MKNIKFSAIRVLGWNQLIKALIGFIVFLAVAYLLISTNFLRQGALPRKATTVETTFQVSSLWSLNGVIIELLSGETSWAEMPIFAHDQSLVYVGRNTLDWQRYGSPRRRNLFSGNLEWKKSFSGFPGAAALNSNVIFVGATSFYPRGENGAVFVSTYDLVDGKLLWSKTFKNRYVNIINNAFATDSLITLRGSSNHGVYCGVLSIDVQTGMEVSLERPTSSECLLSGKQYVTLGSLDNGTVIDIDNWGLNNRVIGIDPSNDSVIWEIERSDIVSNIVLDGNTIYFLTRDGNLWAINGENGHGEKIIRFESRIPLLSTTLSDVSFYNYIVVSDNVLVIYLRDSYQFFAFRLLGEE